MCPIACRTVNRRVDGAANPTDANKLAIKISRRRRCGTPNSAALRMSNVTLYPRVSSRFRKTRNRSSFARAGTFSIITVFGRSDCTHPRHEKRRSFLSSSTAIWRFKVRIAENPWQGGHAASRSSLPGTIPRMRMTSRGSTTLMSVDQTLVPR